jgi:serine/threonine protein kinase
MGTLPPGTRLGSYTIVELLGAGGMGAVYRARDERVARDVAIKILFEGLTEDTVSARFRREARAAAAVSHPNVLQVHEANWEHDLPFLVIELAPGGSLADRIKTSGRLPWRQVAGTGAEIARGLAAIHAAGLVHRDLKPANVLFDDTGRAKLADFGLALATEGSPAASRKLTVTGEFLGTPQFMSPEQATSAKDVGPAADLFSLGGTLYAALAGRPPFEGNGPQLLYKIFAARHEPVRRLVPDVPIELDELVTALLAKTPEARPASATAVAEQLETIAAAQPPVPRGRGIYIGSAMVGLLALLALALLLVSGRAPKTEPQASPSPVHPSPSPSARPSASPPVETALGLPEGFVQSPDAPVEAVFGSYAWKDTGDISAIAFRKDGGLVTANRLGNLRTWEHGRAAVHVDIASGLQAAAFLDDESHVIAGFASGPIQVADLSSLKSWPLAADFPFENVVELGFVSESKFVARNEAGKLATGELNSRRIEPYDSGGGEATAIATCPETNAFAIGFDAGVDLHLPDGTVAPIGTGNHVQKLAFSGDGLHLAVLSREHDVHELRLFDGQGQSREPAWTRRFLEASGIRWEGIRLAPVKEQVLLLDGAGKILVIRASEKGDRDLGFATETQTSVVSTALAVDVDEKTVAVVARNAISLWDLASGKRITPLVDHQGPVRALAVSADGKSGLSGGDDARVLLWDLAHRDAEPLSFREPGGPVTAVALARDGKYGVSADSRRVQLMTFGDRREASEFDLGSGDHEIHALAFSPEGTAFVCGDIDPEDPSGRSRCLRTWPIGLDSTSRLPLKSDSVEAVTWPLHDLILAGLSNGQLSVWRPRGEERPGGGFPLRRRLISIACTADAKRVATGDDEGNVWLCLVNPAIRNPGDAVGATVHQSEVRGVALFDDGRTLVSASRDGHLAISRWERPWEGTPDTELVDLRDEACSLAASTDSRGDFVLVGTYRGTILKFRIEEERRARH